MKILHISDLHFEGLEEETIYPGVRENMDKVRDSLRRQNADYMIVTGDLTTNGCFRRESLVQAKQWLDELELPYIAVPGNHDTGANLWRSKEYPLEYYEPVPFEQTNFGTVFKQPSVVCDDLGDILIIGLVLRENDPDQALSKLREILAENDTNKPVILCGHYPLVQVRNEGVLASFGFKESIPATATALRAIIDEYENIKIYACGHIHASSVKKLTRSCLQISSGGLGPGPSTYRLYSISAGRLGYQTLLGAGPLHFWKYKDIASSNESEYHLGTDIERFGDVDLNQGAE